MLVLSRKVGQELVIGDNIRIVVSRVAGNRVSLGIQAPGDVHIMRAELQEIREGFAETECPSSPEAGIPLSSGVELELITSLVSPGAR